MTVPAHGVRYLLVCLTAIIMVVWRRTAQIRLLAILLVLSVVDRSGGSPKHKWPLTSRTVMWDEQDDTNMGELDMLFVWCPFIVADTCFSHGSFLYDDQLYSLATFPIPETGYFDSFSFTLWLKPDASAIAPTPSPTVIFEYVSDSENDPQAISRVKAELLSGGQVRMTIGKSTTTFHTLTSSVALVSSDFTRLLLCVDKNKRKMYVTIGDVDAKLGLSNEYSIEVPGGWTVGTGDNGPPYKGKITCIGFFDYYVEHDDPDLGCTESYSPSGVSSCPILPESQPTTSSIATTTSSIATTTTTTTISSSQITTVLTETTSTDETTITSSEETTLPQTWSPNPQYIWPLDNVTRGYDVISGTGPWTSPQMLACLRTAENFQGSWNLTNVPLYLDGSSQSSLNLQVNDSVFSNNFTVVVFVKSQWPSEGQLWTFIPSVVSSSSISRISVDLSVSGVVTVTVWTPGYDIPCGQTTAITELNNTTDVFTMVMVQKDSKELKLVVDDSVWTTAHECGDFEESWGQGSLHVAGREKGISAGFRGSLACLAVFSESLHSVNEAEFLRQCDSHYGSSFQVPLVACDDTPVLQQGQFRLFVQDFQPQLTMSLVPMTSLRTNSVVRCAKSCLQTRYCRSFTFTTHNLTSSCDLYDFVTFYALVHSPGSRYYEVYSGPIQWQVSVEVDYADY